MQDTYPVTFDVLDRPRELDRAQLALRFAIGLVLGMLKISLSALWGIIYLLLPVAAALLVSRNGRETFERSGAPKLTSLLRWLMAASAYFALLTDRFPTEHPERIVQFDVTSATTPTVGSALVRLSTTIPAMFVLAVLWIPGAIVWLIAAISILVNRRYAPGLGRFLLGIERYQARMLAYHASLVDRYPPFVVETGAQPSNVPA